MPILRDTGTEVSGIKLKRNFATDSHNKLLVECRSVCSTKPRRTCRGLSCERRTDYYHYGLGERPNQSSAERVRFRLHVRFYLDRLIRKSNVRIGFRLRFRSSWACTSTH